MEEQFVLEHCYFDEVKVLATLFGGSRVYLASINDARWDSLDWDGALILGTKVDIFNLVNGHRSDLMKMLDLKHEEYPQLLVPNPSSARWDDFDAVRFAGLTTAGQRKSVKILSIDYFSNSRTTALNILSYKDRRVFQSSTPEGDECYLIHQVSRIEDGMCILHDQWIFKDDTKSCGHGSAKSLTVFGPTTDLLMSGVWIYGDAAYGQPIQEHLLEYYAAVAHQYATVETLARSPRFSDHHRQWLTDRLSALNAGIQLSTVCACANDSELVMYGVTYSVKTNLEPKWQSQASCLPSGVQTSLEAEESSPESSANLSIFSSNSTNWVATLAPNAGIKSATVKIFCKRSKNGPQERWGAEKAACFYPRVQIPLIHRSGQLLYPYFRGKTESELRMSFIQGGRSDRQLASMTMEIELIKAEDMLRAYRRSLKSSAKDGDLQESPPIDRFYYERLASNARFNEFYADGVEFHGIVIPLSSFLCMPLIVNGNCYPSLGEISRKASSILHSKATSSCPQTFGLGDAHGGNIMVSQERGPDYKRDMLYIDYEVAGYHSAMLDMAKPFYTDILFDILYADHLKDLLPLEYGLDEKAKVIKIKLNGACGDWLGQGILNIKRRYLLEPLFDLATPDGCSALEAHIPQLAYALFSCACMTRNFQGQWESLFRNVAVGVMFSQVTNLEELWACCRSLGLHSNGRSHENIHRPVV
ncbi:uncharacterized protein KY384_005340 [Bacidia gigantensis]|uniref:uncharacterized protein n=1 Tax=Bacidia gigantensis TaxID=2732470 RepID=UPI001D0468A2|nr:uncharacterized protein KY384_005340 [Bacidia gigantensis]KAG8529859.1 hypothetical protein KY384_005340 [Bacidia gigantensis]